MSDIGKKAKLLTLALSELMDKMCEEGYEKYKDELWEVVYDLAKIEYEPLLSAITERFSILAKEKEEALVKGNMHLYVMCLALEITAGWDRSLVNWLIRERASHYYDDLLIIVRLTEIVEVMERLVRKTMTLPSSEALQKLREEIEELKRRRIEVAVKVSKRVEKELKAWLKEREEIKKALKEAEEKIKQYII